MKQNDVKVGGTYSMKVGAEVVSVRITDERWKGNSLDGWVGVNLKTNRSVRIKTAQKLRAEVGDGSAQDAAGDAPASTSGPPPEPRNPPSSSSTPWRAGT